MAKLKHLLDAPQSRWEHIEFMCAWAKDHLLGEGYSRFDLETYSYDPTQGRCGWRHLSPEQLDALLRKYPKGRNEGKRVKPDAIIGAAWRVYATGRYLLENGHDDRACEIFLSESGRLATYAFVHSKAASAAASEGGRRKSKNMQDAKRDSLDLAKGLLVDDNEKEFRMEGLARAVWSAMEREKDRYQAFPVLDTVTGWLKDARRSGTLPDYLSKGGRPKNKKPTTY